jgi:MoaA/NifB/PqqE/SkfB family radical SAM enzyme
MLKGARLLRNLILPRGPVLCLWQVTGRCDFSCKICPFWQVAWAADEELSLEQITRVVQRLEPLAPMMITLGGGEPLLRQDLAQIVRAVAEDHYCSVVTNGWRMTRSTAAELYRCGLRDAMVSIDYAVPSKHDEQRGMPGAFERAVIALEHLRDARPSKAHRVRILAVLQHDNIEELEGLLLMAQELSVSLSITLYSDYLGKGPDRSPRGPVSEQLLELKRRHPCFDSAVAYLASFDRALAGGVTHCGGGRTFINISPRGMISRCIDRYDRPVADPLTDSTGAILASLRRELEAEPCAQCWTSCRGLADLTTGLAGVTSYPDLIRSRSG